MRPGVRSLNLSNAVAVAVYEAWRQLDFAGAAERSRLARYCCSDRGSRCKSRSTASRGASPSYSTRYTASQIGISTSHDGRGQRATAAAAGTPSATCPSSSSAAASDAPRASASPTRRLRDKSPVHVSTRSPSPASPIIVSRRPPMRGTEAPHLREPARDQRGARIVAEAEAVARAGRDREHVLHRASRLRRPRCRRSRTRAAYRRATTKRRGTPRRNRSPRPRPPSAIRARLRRRSSAPRRRRPAHATAARDADEAARRPPGSQRSAGLRRIPWRARRAARERRRVARSRAASGNAATGVATIRSEAARRGARGSRSRAANPAARCPGRYLSLTRRARDRPACAASRAYSVTASVVATGQMGGERRSPRPRAERTRIEALRARTPARSARSPSGRRDA